MKCYYCGRKAEQEIAEIWVCDDEDCVKDAKAVLQLRQERPAKDKREPMPWWNDEIGELVYS
jgi:hypothetical protein